MRIPIVFKRAGFILALPLILVPAAFGQANSGTIVGTVTDMSGASVPNCKVVAKNQATGITKETNTDSSGDFRISYLLPAYTRLLPRRPTLSGQYKRV